jgi:hypothetical protein
MKLMNIALAVLSAGVTLSACAQAPQSPARNVSGQAASTPAVSRPARTVDSSAANTGTAASNSAALPKVLVHKSASCGCCGGWVEHMRQHGFTVDVHDTDALEPIKKRLGVPLGKGSCHTAEVGRLVIEGHVPAGDIKRLLAMGDDARGLVLPGMPLGSPGMESPDGRVQRYTVERVNADGSTVPFATHGR